jgi:acyl-CoA reductase-like NAD-dependent aldehyde dehydrogenase
MVEIAEQALAADGRNPKDGFRRYVKKEPLGVVMVIAPWNYPYLTAVNTIVPALMAGNRHPQARQRRRCWSASASPRRSSRPGCRRACSRTSCSTTRRPKSCSARGRSTTSTFTGSVAGGRAHREGCGRHVHDLGSRARRQGPGLCAGRCQARPCGPNLVEGAFFNSGQCCCGIERIYVHEKVYDDFVEASSRRRRATGLGNPLDQSTVIGPMAQARFADFIVREQTAEAVRKGATAHLNTKDEGQRQTRPISRRRC